jgi:hypothetical protein
VLINVTDDENYNNTEPFPTPTTTPTRKPIEEITEETAKP